MKNSKLRIANQEMQVKNFKSRKNTLNVLQLCWFSRPHKIVPRNFLLAISGVVNRHFLSISCLVIVQWHKK
jgi:hypothetical protein